MADLALARKVLQTEAAAILALIPRVDERFDRAIDMLHACRGRVILTGMGKSGIICRKIAATLTSTGTASQFLHPAEAVHGDLGVIQGDDVVIHDAFGLVSYDVKSKQYRFEAFTAPGQSPFSS